jgi:HEAT repeat protein
VAVPDLVDFLRKPDYEYRRLAAYALGKIGPDAKAAVPALLDMLKKKHVKASVSRL